MCVKAFWWYFECCIGVVLKKGCSGVASVFGRVFLRCNVKEQMSDSVEVLRVFSMGSSALYIITVVVVMCWGTGEVLGVYHMPKETHRCSSTNAILCCSFLIPLPVH
ncbi:hypothetical protein E2C01_019647 [Portunus trituberculatus]|uniref:Uncharacterized protein n=1 Tax=Portunus trituberculatus TaxID=210409 RepID=A0A5B7DZ11_PORTR|nr:hypothetical protein [Portunus trituberculatus]